MTSGFNVAPKATLLDTSSELDGTEMIEISQGAKAKRISMDQVHALGLTPVEGVAAAGKLTSSGAMVPATHAVNILTSNATNVTELDTVTIGSTVYRFMDTTVAAYDVKIAGSAALTLDNLKAAVNASGTGDGTDYHTGIAAHPDVVATDNADTTQNFEARIPGTVPNTIVTTKSAVTLSWAGTTLGGAGAVPGVTTAGALITIGDRVYTVVTELSENLTTGNVIVPVVDQILYGGDEATMLDNLAVAIDAGATEGTNYSTGTVAHADVTAGANDATTQIVAARVKGVLGNDIAVAESLANTVWDDTELGTEVAGVDGTLGKKGQIAFDATNIYICKAISGIADSGNWVKVAHGSL
jgi:hypothetical protein